MPISPWALGQIAPTWTVVMMRDSKPLDLTGVTTGQISMLVYTSSRTLTITGTGTVTIVDVNPAVITYAPVAADIPTTSGQYYVRFKVNFNGTTPDYSDYIPWSLSA